jgi:hypothetical protein
MTDTIKQYREIQLTTDWGYELHFVCPTCSAIVKDLALHQEWHDAQGTPQHL